LLHNCPNPDDLKVSDGIVLYDKSPGASSFDVVRKVRQSHRSVKVGHAGTLDPFATGLLIVLIGKATRVQRIFMELPKTYRVTARLGARSTTGDPEGIIEETGLVPPVDRPLPTGKIMQKPPSFSAIKVNGERAYKKARRGEMLDLPPREVTIYRFEQLWRESQHAEYEVECSSGTYIRSLIADLDDAYCVQLRRTKIGDFDVKDADGKTVPLEEALGFLAAQPLSADELPMVRNGRAVECRVTAGKYTRLLDGERLVAIAEQRGQELQPKIVIQAD
jgi:tRNA pseudouridine55 synthase